MKNSIPYALFVSLMVGVSCNVMAGLETSIPMAAPKTATLTINGKIIPGSCNIELSPNHVEMVPIRFGVLDVKKNFVELEGRVVELFINCTAKTSVVITAEDENSIIENPFLGNSEEPRTQVSGILKYKDAKDGADKAVGVYALQLEGMRYANGVKEYETEPISHFNIGGGGWKSSDAILLNGVLNEKISWKSQEESGLAVGDYFYSKISITPFLLPASKLKTSDEIDYEGKTTITLTYY